jgi:hypothetical protein
MQSGFFMGIKIHMSFLTDTVHHHVDDAEDSYGNVEMQD